MRVTPLGKSVEGRELALHLFGSGDRPVLIIAAVHGDEPTTVAISRGIEQILQSTPNLTSLAGDTGGVAILAVANPDGLEKQTRVNANKVDINRNFPAANWTSSLRKTQYYNGPSPASEPETRAIMQAVQMLKPSRILTIHSIGQARECNNYDGPAKDLADIMSLYNHYPARETIGYPTPGSYGSWAGIDQHIPTITLELPRHLPPEQAWNDNRQAVLAFIRGPEEP
jgi:murein peptide amidase A